MKAISCQMLAAWRHTRCWLERHAEMTATVAGERTACRSIERGRERVSEYHRLSRLIPVAKVTRRCQYRQVGELGGWVQLAWRHAEPQGPRCSEYSYRYRRHLPRHWHCDYCHRPSSSSFFYSVKFALLLLSALRFYFSSPLLRTFQSNDGIQNGGSLDVYTLIQ